MNNCSCKSQLKTCTVDCQSKCCYNTEEYNEIESKESRFKDQRKTFRNKIGSLTKKKEDPSKTASEVDVLEKAISAQQAQLNILETSIAAVRTEKEQYKENKIGISKNRDSVLPTSAFVQYGEFQLQLGDSVPTKYRLY